MQLPQNQDRDLLNLWTEFNSEPSPYLSPIHWPTPQECPQLQDYFIEIDIDPLSNYEIDQILPLSKTSEELEMVQINKEIQKQDEQSVFNKIYNDNNAAPVTIIKSETKIKSLIHLLVENDQLPSKDLLIYGNELLDDDNSLKQVFQILLNKFKKLKKTKQQMTKYCMRKAFKFVADMKNVGKVVPLKKKNSHKMYDQQDSEGVELPFKKNSSQKTMNSQFLRQVFSRKQFVNGYKKFLESIHQTIEEDNKAKIQFLSQTVQNCLRAKDIKKIQSLKRLPWPKSILVKTQQLAHQLLQSSTKQNLQDQFKQNN